jgi:hypothetical protein
MSRLVVRDGKETYRLSQAKIKALKKMLRFVLSLDDISLREVASIQTLGRFVNEKDYVPANLEVCKALGIIAEPNPYRILPSWYNRTPEALAFFNRKREQIKEMSVNAKNTIKETRDGLRK